MTISLAQQQLTNYLTQIWSFSNQSPIPKITYKLIADKLAVSPPCISKLLAEKENTPKPLKNFKLKYLEEFEKWPEGKKTIERSLSIFDAMYFLGISEKPIRQNTLRPTIEVKQKRLVPTPMEIEAVKKPVLIKTPATRPLLQIAHNPTKKFTRAHAPIAPLAVSYRGHESIKDGQGMLFDHMRFQDLTKFQTRTLMPENAFIKRDATKFFKQALENHPATLLYGEKDENLITYPSNVRECANLGLLIIPGRVKKMEDEPIRLKHEYEIIRGALNRGQPILGICAGSWRLYEQLYIWSRYPESLTADPAALSRWHQGKTIIEVKDHCYNGGMIRLGVDGVQAVCNVQIHNILIKENSLLSKSMTIFGNREVNSVHWKAVNKDNRPENVEICAEAMKCPTISIHTRLRDKMTPQEGIAEAFETVHGTPLLGIQWHPEGYGIQTSHAKLIQYMALAGSAYAVKRQMLRELNANPPALKKHA